MNLLVIECCSFTRLGICSFLRENEKIHIVDCESISQAMQKIPNFRPTLIIVNATNYCKNSELSTELKEFIAQVHNVKVYCYLDAKYPVTDIPIPVTHDFHILNKYLIISLLQEIVSHSERYSSTNISRINRSIFSDQEILVMNYWMSEMPNHRIARKLDISSRTVYVYKRNLTQKIKVRNRLEFCFIYNFIKYIFWPIDQASNAPLSRQEKEDILTLYR
ncbi:response regulator transcription factor [Ewingella sp. S1.OA.A_B6]